MNTIVEIAQTWLGTPYHHQQSVKGAGCDCLGLIRGIWRELYGVEPEQPPPYAQTWGDYTGEETLLKAAARNLDEVAVAPPGRCFRDPRIISWDPGHVLFFRPRSGSIAKHCAVLVADNVMIHAYSGVGVRQTSVGIWDKRVAGIFKFPGFSSGD